MHVLFFKALLLNIFMIKEKQKTKQGFPMQPSIH